MAFRRIYMALTLVAMAVTTTGCRVVRLSEYESLQQSHAELQARYQDLDELLQSAQGKASQLQDQLSESGRKASMAEMEAARLRKQLEDAGKTGATPTGWQQTPTGAQISVGGDLLFASGRAVLTSSGHSKVTEIAGTIKSRYGGYVVRVCGYTDADPIRRSGWKDNLELSAERAMAVTRELIKAGVPADQIETVAFGAARPVAPNTTADGKAKNRRVVIQVFR